MSTVNRPAVQELQFVSWPLRDDPLYSLAMLGFSAAVAIVSGWVAASLLVGIAAGAALAAVFWRLWFPIRIEIGPQGIHQTVFGIRWRLPWYLIARFQPHRHGVQLFAAGDPDPMGSLKSRFLPCRRNREQVLEMLEYFLVRRSDSSLRRLEEPLE